MNIREVLLNNRIVGLVLLVVLAFVAGPNTLPRFLANLLPSIIYEGVPCAWLRRADDRANHQSLIGRAAPRPIQVRVQADPVPTDPSLVWGVRIIIVNESLGTVPIAYDPNEVIVGDNGTNGVGLIFTPPNSLTTGFVRPGGTQTLDSDLRLLGPRQRCVHTVEFPAGNVLIDGSVPSGLATVRAYYRSGSAGQIIQQPPIVATPIFNDQGLWTGYIESEQLAIPRPIPPQ
jgi:hypothetical protein